MGKTFVYVGTWTVQAPEDGGGIGIYAYREEDGSLEHLDTVHRELTAGMICIDQRRGVLYVIDEKENSADFGGEGGGGQVLAFSIDRETGALTELGQAQPSFGTLPAYVAQDGSGNWLVVCNHSERRTVTKYEREIDGRFRVVTEYSAVTAALYPLAADGTIGEAADIVSFPPDRSVCPPKVGCLHFVRFAADGEHLVMTNMKQDMVLAFFLDRKVGTLRECGRLIMPEGNFPHYLAFHPGKPLLYLNNEHAPVLNVVRYDGDWNMEVVQTVVMTPEADRDMTGKKVMQTDVLVSADGAHVYVPIRGENSIRVFDVDEETGFLTEKQGFYFGTDGNPRGIALSPDGRFLLAAENANHLVETFAVQQDGSLVWTGQADGSLSYPGNISFYQA